MAPSKMGVKKNSTAVRTLVSFRLVLLSKGLIEMACVSSVMLSVLKFTCSHAVHTIDLTDFNAMVCFDDSRSWYCYEACFDSSHCFQD